MEFFCPYSASDHAIIYTYDPCEKMPVYKETIGQYIGREDKNGKKIFEGDIVKLDKWDRTECQVGVIKFQWGIYVAECIICGKEYLLDLNKLPSIMIEIIGNIYDNPDLLHKANKKSN